MSRIYEALQKAESERRLERREPEPRTAEPPFNSAIYATVVATAEEEQASSVAEPYARTESSSVQRPVVGVDPNALDLSKIPLRPWALSLERLPSLLERGPAVEQFRSLRSRLFELRDISPLKSIMVTSGLPQEGKSFISTNLALSLARHKSSKVLLVDGDMRRYTLHQLLGCESHPGLAEYLAGKASLVEVMQRSEPSEGMTSGTVAVTQNLTFIAGGNGGDKAADLSGSPRFEELIRLAAPHFDWIIVDSSPVLPVSDAVNLARACDGVLLVARSGQTKFPVAQRAQSELKASNILGFVLNAVQEAPQVGSYYGYDAAKP
jgi:protein-tyrosine kinase